MTDDLKLRIYIEGNAERIIKVDRDEFVMGRLAECSLCLPFSEISRYHARIIREQGSEWFIEDLGSTNGTLLNQFRIEGVQPINHGDIIQLGNVFLYVIFPAPPPAKITRIGGDQSEGMTEGRTILRKAEDLQQQWLEAEEIGDPLTTHQTTIARLKDLVEIAKELSSAESIEAIFSRVQEVVFRELTTIERLGLLIDVQEDGQLKLVNAASKNSQSHASIINDSSWISQSICYKVFKQRVAVKVVDAQSDKRFEGEHSLLMKGIRGALAVPLWDKDQVVGVLYADARLRLKPSDPLEEDDLSFFSTLANLVASSVQRWLLTRKLQEEAKIRQNLQRYHSPAVVQQLIAEGVLEDGRIKPIEAEISILFADIVGFTALSERLTPTKIAELLNQLFDEMTNSVFLNGGTLDKYIGDCVMAFFGAPEPQIDHFDRAVSAGLSMLERLDHLNKTHFVQNPLRLRIAINTGKAVVGDVGSQKRVDYTVLGATVNLASRMESICTPGECIISFATFDRLKNKYKSHFHPIGEKTLRGIDTPIRLYQTQRNSQHS